MTEPMPMPPPEKPSEMAGKHVKSKGEKLFDRITYAGIAGVGTLVLTVPVAYEIEHNPKLQPWFNWGVKKAEGLFSHLPFIANPHKAAAKAVETTTLMWGGNLMLIPVGLMEHFKVPIVRGFNAMMKDPTPEIQIEEAPKQTMSSLIKSRMVAWSIVFGSLWSAGRYFEKTFATYKEEFGAHIVTLTDRFRSPAKKIER